MVLSLKTLMLTQTLAKEISVQSLSRLHNHKGETCPILGLVCYMKQTLFVVYAAAGNLLQ